jgi:hypothetical protein
MFVNPVDRDTIYAMASYREQQVLEAFKRSAPDSRTLVVVRRSPSPGPVRAIREKIGLALMRAGARLAGYGVQTRIGTQA